VPALLTSPGERLPRLDRAVPGFSRWQRFLAGALERL